jgi:hypothetical protein
MPQTLRRKPRSGAAHSSAGASVKAKRARRTDGATRDQPEARIDLAGARETKALTATEKTQRRKVFSQQVTRAWVIERLAENVDRAMQIEEIKLRGVPTGEFRYEGSVANRALELIGKELGLFVDRSESVNIHHVVSDEPLTQAQWEEQYVTAP